MAEASTERYSYGFGGAECRLGAAGKNGFVGDRDAEAAITSAPSGRANQIMRLQST